MLATVLKVSPRFPQQLSLISKYFVVYEKFLVSQILKKIQFNICFDLLLQFLLSPFALKFRPQSPTSFTTLVKIILDFGYWFKKKNNLPSFPYITLNNYCTETPLLLSLYSCTLMVTDIAVEFPL